jgi:hypothetical protein
VTSGGTVSFREQDTLSADGFIFDSSVVGIGACGCSYRGVSKIHSPDQDLEIVQ